MITAETQKGHNYYRCTKKREMCSQKYVREELLTEQVKSFLQKVSLPNQDTEKVLRELDKDEQKAREDSLALVGSMKKDLAEVETRLDKLLSAYLDEIISEEEYLAQKQKMLDRRVELKEKIREIEDKGVSWLGKETFWRKRVICSVSNSSRTYFCEHILRFLVQR